MEPEGLRGSSKGKKSTHLGIGRTRVPRDNFMIRGQTRAAFLVVMSRSPDLVVKRKNKITLRMGSGEHILKWPIRAELPGLWEETQ